MAPTQQCGTAFLCDFPRFSTSFGSFYPGIFTKGNHDDLTVTMTTQTIEKVKQAKVLTLFQ